MKSKIMKAAIKLQNGFNYAERVYSVDAEYKVTEIHSTGECTWVGSESVNGDVEIEIPAGSIALVRVGFPQFGITPVEVVWGELDLEASLPESLQPSEGILWSVEYDQATRQPYQILTLGHYIQAKIEDKVEVFDSENWVEMPYSWGHQAAACFWRLMHGELQVVSGEGEYTPELLTTGEFTSLAEQREEELIRFDKSCDAAESFQGGAVFSHLKSSFAFQNNPLPSLRKKFGGEWKYHDKFKELRAVWRDNGEPMMFVSPEGCDWIVTYKPE
jgi:hypothetical protein